MTADGVIYPDNIEGVPTFLLPSTQYKYHNPPLTFETTIIETFYPFAGQSPATQIVRGENYSIQIINAEIHSGSFILQLES